MSNSSSHAGNETPDQLLGIFSQTKISHGIFVGIALHLLLLGATSISYFRKAETPAVIPSAPEKQQSPIAAPPEARSAAPSSSNDRPERATSETKTEEQLLEERNKTPIVKAITEQTPSAEAPSTPAAIGLSLEDTEPGR